MARPTEEEIREQSDEADAHAPMFGGECKFPGMSYSDGVASALAWVLGNSGEKPMEE
ncbi:MAG: hypothetical protein BWY85_00457 [Firmicutes bacterium ADurb.Bin506]|nr:MAG: hypothetical protein BWY85_00457 [Firmicutes bacterium ADurb.Bin506]